MDCYPQSRPVTQQSEGTVFNRKLYMHQIFDGPDYNHVNIANPGQPQMFGCTNVHDYPIYDSLDPNAKIVARAQGLHTETCLDYDNWFHWSRLVFRDESFEGSSFIAIGDQNKITGEWAIVGGTGVFAFAKGTITIYRVQDSGSSNIKEICIRALGFTGQATPIEIKLSNSVSLGPLTPHSQATEYIRTWYMHQIITGTDYNQVPIANPEKPEMFGYTNVHDYPIYDSLGPGKKIVARAQGLHSKTSMNNGGSWLHWSKVVFDYERFQGSSFNAIGNQEGEWAIVGGTGEFALVQGTVTTHRVRESGPSNIKEIRIHAFCYPPTTPFESNNEVMLAFFFVRLLFAPLCQTE
ncbi:uncharacterized protein [Miscanthus floridulus]|uniref:uncharacterized protein n=1 Tax=Miscanthus floridulus TaxID=154761 RepID=UPI00345AA3A2